MIQHYLKAYERLKHCTPLPYDCGRLCDGVCCRGENGMWLFPGEEELLREELSFKIEPLEWTLRNGRPLYWMTCAGECERALRPLACRIFPLGPYLKRDIVTVGVDPRAEGICPLAKEKQKLQQTFIRTVGRVCRELATQSEIKEFIGLWSEEMAEIRHMEALLRP